MLGLVAHRFSSMSTEEEVIWETAVAMLLLPSSGGLRLLIQGGLLQLAIVLSYVFTLLDKSLTHPHAQGCSVTFTSTEP